MIRGVRIVFLAGVLVRVLVSPVEVAAGVAAVLGVLVPSLYKKA